MIFYEKEKRVKSKEKRTLIYLYQYKKISYEELVAKIEEWIGHYNIAAQYDYRFNTSKQKLGEVLKAVLAGNHFKKGHKKSIKYIMNEPDLYELFGAPLEECRAVEIENETSRLLANLSEEKLKKLICRRDEQKWGKNDRTEAVSVSEHQAEEKLPDSQGNAVQNKDSIIKLEDNTVFRIGNLTADFSHLYTSNLFHGKKWEKELNGYVQEMVNDRGFDNKTIYRAVELASELVKEHVVYLSGNKSNIFLSFAKYYATTLDAMLKKGIDESDSFDCVADIAKTAMRASIQEMTRNQKKTVSESRYLHHYEKEYMRRKKQNLFIEQEQECELQEDEYVNDGRPAIEQYILQRAHKEPKTGLVYVQLPTGEAKSYTIEEIICKAIKGVKGYTDLFERYERIVVTTIQNKLITPESLREKHGTYNLTEEECENNVVVIRGLLENLRHNFSKAKELMPIDMQESAPFKELEEAYNAATKNSRIYTALKAPTMDIDIVAGANIQQQVAFANRRLIQYATGKQSILFKHATDRAMARYEYERAKEDVEWKNLSYKDKIQRIRAEQSRLVVEDSNYKWMTVLWPSLLVAHRKVILSTVSKMEYPSFDFENGITLPYISWTKNALLFADEGDASKQYQAMPYIKNQSTEVYDLKLLLCRIYEQLEAALGAGREDTRRRKEEWERLEKHYADMYGTTDEKLNYMEAAFETLQKIVKQYHLTARFKSKAYIDKEMVLYVYAGGLYFSAGGAGGKAEFAAFYNEETGMVDVYRLTLQEGKTFADVKAEIKEEHSYRDEAEIDLKSMTAAMRHFAILFAKQIHRLAIAYQDLHHQTVLKNNQAGNVAQVQMSDRSAWRNVLRALGMDDEHHTCADFLKNLIPPVLPGKTYGKMSSFYTYGWSATTLVFDIDSQEDLRFGGFSVPTTAERILGTEATQGLVFCLSGTMDIDSSISNYNRNELLMMLGSEHVSSLTEDSVWMRHVEEELKNKWQPYYDGRIQIHADYGNWPLSYKLDEKETNRDIATMHILQKYLRKAPECTQHIAELVNRAGESDFERDRLITFSRLAEEFIFGNLPAHLHFEKKLVEENQNEQPQWSFKTLQQIFEILVEAKSNRTKEKEDIELISLTSSVFNDAQKWQRIKEKRAAGQRQYLVTAYDTTGVGVNVESKRPITVSDDQIELLQFQSKNDARTQKMDVPSLYLGPITNNHVPVRNNVQSMDDVMERINETLNMIASYEITPFEGSLSLRTIMALYENAHGIFKKDDYLVMPGYRKDAEKDIHQAIGRILRGGCKSKHIYIYISDDIGKILGKETPKRMLLPPETNAVYQAVLKHQDGILENPEKYTYIIRNLTQGMIYHNQVQSMIKRDRGAVSMRHTQIDEYENLKKKVVAVYSSNDTQYDNEMYAAFERPVDKYYYAKLRDYENCIVDTDFDTVMVYKSINSNKTQREDVWKQKFDATVYDVSEEKFCFASLFAYPGMREHFVEKGMFTSCAPGRFVLCPEAANLARGVQGEVASKFILHKELGMICNDITDGVKYERFDVQLRPGIYIDFKNYANGDLLSQQLQDLICHAQQKAKKIQARKVYIVNLIATENSMVDTYDDYTHYSVPIVYINGLINANGQVIVSHLAQFLEEDYETKKDE